MKTVPEIALQECIGEFRAACRRPIDQAAVDTVAEWLRPNFDRILNRLDGGKRWADHGQRMRDNSRHLGALADFFGSHAGVPTVGIEQLSQAWAMLRADCTTKGQRTPLAYEYCTDAPVDARAAEEFLRAIAPAPALVTRAG